ncbi:MAG: chemotaxis protein CheR, partial [Proteobacteria bacterium]|nr:chemotaxis protein CheR [Pseudomonadota bacterium]
RNVLIYQSVENKKKVIAKIARLLNPGGILVLGAAESLIGLSEEFKLVRVDRACYYEIAARP